MADRVAWPPSPYAHVFVFMLAVMVSAAAVGVWRSRRPNLAAVVALFAIAVHPPLLVAVAPLLAHRPVRAMERGDYTRLAVVVVAAVLLLALAAPDCQIERRGDTTTVALGIIAVLRSAVGPIAIVLALFETVRSLSSSHVRVAWLVIAAAIAATFFFQSFDARLTLAPAAVGLWWLAVTGGAAIVAMRPSVITQIGAALIMVLVPSLQLWAWSARARATAQPATGAVGTVIATLEKMWRPSLLLSADAVHDAVANVWAIGERRHGTTFEVVDAVRAVAAAGAGRVVYAFAAGAAQLERRGIVMAPLATAGAATRPLLWRAFSGAQCTVLTHDWQDVSALAVNGQVSGVFERGATGRHAVMYAPLPAAPSIASIRWPQVALDGLRLTGFDLTNAEERRQYYQAAVADEMPLTMIPADTPHVARIILGRMERDPGSLAIAFNSIPTRLLTRLDSGGSTDRLEICRSGQDLAVVGFEGETPVNVIDLSSPAAFGNGWHTSERVDDVRYRWTSQPDAQLRFIAVSPARLAVRLQVLEAAGGKREAASVDLNGVAATCDPRGDSCAWMLPIEAMKTGLNVITLHAPVGTSAEGVALGLKVGGVTLEAQR